MNGERPHGEPAQQPAGLLLHPLPLAAVALLVVNDHVVKRGWPGWWSGKLSDVAGLVYFPLLLVAAWEWWRHLRGAPLPARPRATAMAVMLTAVVFSAVQLSAAAGDAYALALGWARWPLDVARALLAGSPPPTAGGRVAHVADPTDLLALPALAVPLLLGRRATPRVPRRRRASEAVLRSAR